MARRRLDGGWHVPEAAFESDRMDRERGRVRMLNGALEGGREDWTMDLVQYDLVRDLIHEAFDDHADADGTLLLKDLVAISQERLGRHPAFPGGRMRNITTYVKVDLEARREIERINGTSPQRLRRLGRNR